jgi:uncharacterized protein (DUF1015 family)
VAEDGATLRHCIIVECRTGVPSQEGNNGVGSAISVLPVILPLRPHNGRPEVHQERCMAEFRPFRGLRYDPAQAGPLDTVIAPPYDVISPAQQRTLYGSSPHNVVRIELGREQGSARYAAAAALLAQWRRDGVLRPEESAALYLYEQRFRRDGRAYQRRALFGRVRLAPYASGVVRPHEFTLAGPKEDRLRLIEATRTQISPVYLLYRSGADDPLRTLAMPADASSATDITGEQHLFAPVTDELAQHRIAEFLKARTLYIADGHHRYETSLRYRDERRQAAADWSGDEPENFVMAALTPHDDPGLLILPIHRIVRRPLPEGALERLRRFFNVQLLPAGEGGGAQAATARLQAFAGRETAFAAAGLFAGQIALLTLRDRDAVEALMPEGRTAAWRALDVNVLQYGVFEAALGIGLEAIAVGGAVEFSEHAAEAVREVEHGRASAAFLLNPTRVDEVFAVADGDDRMPQKSTFFYPKLGTGLVLHAFDV